MKLLEILTEWMMVTGRFHRSLPVKNVAKECILSITKGFMDLSIKYPM